MYLGRYFQGQTLNVTVRTLDENDTPGTPDNPPYIDLRDDSGLVRQVQAPIVDRYTVTGLFVYPLFLDSSFPAGRYSATHFYRVGTHSTLDVDYFEVIAGGDPEGAIVSQHYWQRPEATYLVQETEGESLLLRRNPAI